MCILNLKAYHSFFHHNNHMSNIFLLVSPISFHLICLRACSKMRHNDEFTVCDIIMVAMVLGLGWNMGINV